MGVGRFLKEYIDLLPPSFKSLTCNMITCVLADIPLEILPA